MSAIKRHLRRHLKRAGDAAVATLAIALVKGLRHVDMDRLADIAGWITRKVGPLLREHKLAREQLVAAFPEKTPAEIETILAGVWDNLGRVGAEFAHLERLSDFDPRHPDPNGRIGVGSDSIERFFTLLNDNKPALVFTAHYANWELPAVIAARCKIDSAVLYRRPNNARIDEWLHETRDAAMGQLIAAGLEAPVKLGDALRAGKHVGMLVDQYYVRGVEVTFFGRKTRANPLIARLAQHFDCPIHGIRVVRQPGHRFRGELTEAVEPVRDADGNVDVAATMQVIMSVIEGWIREHPEQWLWLHRRWRPEDDRR